MAGTGDITRSNRRRPAGFTLVELLVVVAIVALLLSMMLPSLQLARESARRAVCGAHMRGLMTAWEVYATDFGSLPELARNAGDLSLRFDDDDGDGQLETVRFAGLPDMRPENWTTLANGWFSWLGIGQMTAGMFFAGNPGGAVTPENYGTYSNFGLLHTRKTVQDVKTFYCPSQRNWDFQFNTRCNPWPPDYDLRYRPDVTYIFNHTDGSFERRLGLSWVPWERVPSRTVVMFDVLLYRLNYLNNMRPRSWNELQGCHKTGINVAHRNGGVSFLRDKPFKDAQTDEVWSLSRWSPENGGAMKLRRDYLQLVWWMDRQ